MSTSQPIPPRAALVGGKYRLNEVIGSGGVGTVYRATHLWTEREVAVKVLDQSLPHFHQLRDAFLMEARATVQLRHPNVVEVLDMGEDEAGATYMVMELLDGPTLRDVLAEQGRLPSQETATILLPIIDALDYAHELGIVHKDFKPENIILSVDAFDVMTPKLLDFGVAQILRETRSRDFAAPDEVIVGTPQYMSPEQARDERDLIGPQTDVWGVGVVWYECLTGRSPFDRDTPLEVLNAVCEAPIDFDGVPESQASFLKHALERSPRRRTQRLSELRAQIEQSGLVVPATTDRVARSSRPPASERPSYAHRTLQGVGPSAYRSSGSRPVRFDSEPLSLPKRSNRKSVLGGLALTIAVGLAAWWTIDESRPLESRILESPTVEVTRPERSAEPEPEAAEVVRPERNAEPEPKRVTAPTSEAPPPAATEEILEDVIEDVIEEEHSSAEQAAPVEEALPDPQPRVAPAKAAPKPTTPRTPRTPRTPSLQRPVEEEKGPPASRPGYQKPPDLVTKW